MLNRQKGSGKSSAFCLLLIVFDLIRLYVYVNMESNIGEHDRKEHIGEGNRTEEMR